MRDTIECRDFTWQHFLFAGHDNGVRFIVLPAVSHQVESRNFRNVRSVQGTGTGEVSDGPLRAAGTASTSMDEEDIKLFKRAVGRIRHASRRIY